MSFVRINKIYTMDPGDKWRPKNVFFPNDPFGIMMEVTASPDLISGGFIYDAIFQMVNPQDDPYEKIWYSRMSDSLYKFQTIDWFYTNVRFKYENFGVWFPFSSYSRAVAHVRGPSRLNGVFSVRGSISVHQSDLFDLTAPFGYNYKARES